MFFDVNGQEDCLQDDGARTFAPEASKLKGFRTSMLQTDPCPHPDSQTAVTL